MRKKARAVPTGNASPEHMTCARQAGSESAAHISVVIWSWPGVRQSILVRVGGGVRVRVGVRVGIRVRVGVRVGVGVGVGVGVEVGVGVYQSTRRSARYATRPRTSTLSGAGTSTSVPPCASGICQYQGRKSPIATRPPSRPSGQWKARLVRVWVRVGLGFG